MLTTVLRTPEPPSSRGGTGRWRFPADRIESGVRERAAVQARLDHTVAHLGDVGERDARTGLFTPAFVRRWTAGLGPGLPVGLVLLRVPGLGTGRSRYGLRAEQTAVTGVARAVTGLLTRSDRVVQIAPEDLLLVLPSWPAGHGQVLRDELCGRIGRLAQQYPFVPLPVVGVALIR